VELRKAGTRRPRREEGPRRRSQQDGKNFLRRARPAPFALKYWEVGNECYGTWEYDVQTAQHDQAAGVMPEFLICHRYEQNAGQENDALLLQLASAPATGWSSMPLCCAGR